MTKTGSRRFRYSQSYCVTVSVDRVTFKVPVRVGDLLTMRASVNYVGRTSMEIGVRVEAQDVRGGEARHTNSCYVTMVAIENGAPAPVPKLVCTTEVDRRRHARGSLRCEQTGALDRIHRSENDYHGIVDMASVAILLIDTESLDHLTGDGRRILVSVAAWLIPLPTGALIQRVMRPRS